MGSVGNAVECRHCKHLLEHLFLDLGSAPPSNAYVDAAGLYRPETWYPLRLFVCDRCWLVQTEDYPRRDVLFKSDYAYFSSTSETWLAHARNYADVIRGRANLGSGSLVVEIGCNDGYLLRNFVAAGIPCLGIEPTASTALAAEGSGVSVIREFFDDSLAQRLKQAEKSADLIIANNVYAHVPDINNFTAGMQILLKPGGTITLEFPQLATLIEHRLFDTVYHEHFSYLSLYTVSQIFESHRLRVYDVEPLPTHGGSLRVYGCHLADERKTSETVAKQIANEGALGLRTLEPYVAYQPAVERIKDDLLLFLIEQKRAGKRVAAYGAAAKGNTLLNYAGVKPDLIHYVCDAAPSKQGQFLPGSRIPIFPPGKLRHDQPDIVVVLPWNIADEIVSQHSYIRNWGGRFVVAIPKLAFIGSETVAASKD